MTPAEIVKALRCAATVQTGNEPCESCPFYENEQLDAEWAEKLGTTEWHSCDSDAVGLAAADLIEQLEKEKAALLKYAKKSAGCEQCANYRPRCDAVDCNQCAEDCTCPKCKRGSKWEWKGLKPDERAAV